MTDLEQRECTLGDAFPWLRGQQLASSVLDRELLTESVDGLVRQLTGELSLVAFGSSLPGLHSVASERIPPDQLGTRTANALRRLQIRTWCDLLLVRPDDLLAVANFGETSLADLASLAIRSAADAFLSLAPRGDDGELEEGVAPDIVTEFGYVTDEQLEGGDTGIFEALIQSRLSLAELLPGLRGRPYDTVPADLLPTRLVNRVNHESWASLIDTSITELASMANIGRRSLGELLVRLRHEASRTDGVPSHVLDRPGATERLLADLIELLTWSEQERGATEVGEVLAVSESLLPLPARLAERWDHVASTAIDPLVTHRIGPLLESMIDALDDRQRKIMEQRDWSTGNARTLEDIGDDLDLTRERVRQLETDARTEIRRSLSFSPLDVASDRWEELRRRIGSAIPIASDLCVNALEWSVRDVREGLRPIVQGFLLWRSGPYVIRDGWLILAKDGPDPKGAEIRSAADSSGYVSDGTLHDALSTAGIAEQVHDAWLGRVGNLIRVEDGWLDGSGSMVELAARYLSFRGVPMSIEEILKGIGRTEASVRSVRQRLTDDDRFVRVSKLEVGLRAWGHEEYTSIPEEMAEEIERCGGAVRLDILVERLVDQFGVSPTSVRMYSGRPMFHVDEADQVTLRTDDQPYDVRDDLRLIAGCYELSPFQAAWRVPVDRDVLRGSGRSMPEQLAGWLRLHPGDRFDAKNPRRPVPLSWRPWAWPDIGSLKGFAEDLGATAGDALVLVFERSGSVEVRLARADPEGADGIVQVASLMGIAADGLARTEVMVRIAEVLGVTTAADDDSVRFRVRAALERRRDHDLVALVDKAVFT